MLGLVPLALAARLIVSSMWLAVRLRFASLPRSVARASETIHEAAGCPECEGRQHAPAALPGGQRAGERVEAGGVHSTNLRDGRYVATARRGRSRRRLCRLDCTPP